jgi:carbonic anhydrase
MKKLIQGIKDFRKNTRPSLLKHFGEIALAQKPDTILVACSDSRVAPNVFASSTPGDMFVLRNIGNIIPPYRSEMDETSVLSVFEFALSNLPIKDIIICGHSNCGAMHAILANKPTYEGIERWLDSAKHARDVIQMLPLGATPEEQANAISKLSVLKQIDNLKTYPIVQKRLQEGDLNLHAWYFDIRHADVYTYDFEKHDYVLIE